MTAPAIPDSSDRVIEMSKAKRLHGATVEEWIALIEQNPDRTLPGGVGGAIVVFMKGQLDAAQRATVTLSNELKRIEQASGAPDPFAIADHVLDKMVELHTARDVIADRTKELHTAADAHVRLERQLAEAREIAQKYEDRYFTEKVPSPEFEEAIAWHRRGVELKATESRSWCHVAAILDHFGYTP